MSDPSDDDMDKPITKREALDLFLTKREALELFVTKIEFHDAFQKLFRYLDKKFEAIDKRFEAIDKRFETTKTELRAELRQDIRMDLSAELRSHSGANADQLKREVGLVDDRYKDLPERVTKLEVAVFAPPPAKRQRRR
jgi:predicted metal-dependent hydrolase